jgi:hypothetical protein
MKWFNQATSSSIIGAISGAAGQLHKFSYNKRLQRISEKNNSQ